MKTGVATPWRLKKQFYCLQGSHCSICQQPVFPPRPTHSACREKQSLQMQDNVSFSGDDGVAEAVTNIVVESQAQVKSAYYFIRLQVQEA